MLDFPVSPRPLHMTAGLKRFGTDFGTAKWLNRGESKTATLSLQSVLARAQPIREVTLVIARDGRASVRCTLEGGSVVVPNEAAGEKRVREVSQQFEEAAIAQDTTGALRRLDELAGRGRDALNAAKPVLVAARQTNQKLAEAALKVGADVDPPGMRSPLATAASLGELTLVKLFVEKGAKVDREGISALREAAEHGHIEVVRYLLQRGADPNREIDGQTPLVAAVRSRDVETVNALLDAGAEARAQFMGESVLEFAKRWRAPQTIIDALATR